MVLSELLPYDLLASIEMKCTTHKYILSGASLYTFKLDASLEGAVILARWRSNRAVASVGHVTRMPPRLTLALEHLSGDNLCASDPFNMRTDTMGIRRGLQPNFGDNLRGIWRSIRSGTGGNILDTRRHIKGAMAQRLVDEQRSSRPARKGGWYTKYREGDGTIHLMIGKDGNTTESYPHVHIIHDSPGAEVRIVASRGPGDHPFKEVLPGTASGNEVNQAISRMIAKL